MTSAISTQHLDYYLLTVFPLPTAPLFVPNVILKAKLIAVQKWENRTLMVMLKNKSATKEKQ
jgi:hypothetical protein